MRIYGSIQGNSVLIDPLLVATNESYFIKSTGRTEANVLDDKVIVSKNIRVTPGTHENYSHFYGATKALSSIFVEAIFWFPIVGMVNLTLKTRKNMCPFKIHSSELKLSDRS